MEHKNDFLKALIEGLGDKMIIEGSEDHPEDDPNYHIWGWTFLLGKMDLWIQGDKFGPDPTKPTDIALPYGVLNTADEALLLKFLQIKAKFQ